MEPPHGQVTAAADKFGSFCSEIVCWSHVCSLLNGSDVCFSAVGHETEHWSVYRRYLEFYVLESKLTEFHGRLKSRPYTRI